MSDSQVFKVCGVSQFFISYETKDEKIDFLKLQTIDGLNEPRQKELNLNNHDTFKDVQSCPHLWKVCAKRELFIYRPT
ncbi:hypothetical protein CHS0354_007018 [Potamilus streckersoni]|uniref:Uncharacterized protein n=1 Tax=Potamilus streckersoni TaxID=2493646 RepID=A0AAE0RWT8_9BIVA|nr:hypothetical protein CHS0354_007018 [Potamilus streckersoni]